jgi:uncharacterized membrane protein YeaQ/YmgE (transglycosylase-associated protein family)
MTIAWTAMIGLIVGAAAKFLMPGRDLGGVIITMLIGIAGSLVASWIGLTLLWYRRADSAPGIIASILGAMLLLFVYRTTFWRRRLI